MDGKQQWLMSGAPERRVAERREGSGVDDGSVSVNREAILNEIATLDTVYASLMSAQDAPLAVSVRGVRDRITAALA